MKTDAPDRKPLPRYRPLSRRRRMLLLGLAVATALAVMALLLQPRLRQMQAQAQAAPRAAAAAPCAPGQTQACVGGLTQVIGTSAAAAGSAPAR